MGSFLVIVYHMHDVVGGGQRNVPVHEGVVQNWMCGYYYRTLSCVYCNA